MRAKSLDMQTPCAETGVCYPPMTKSGNLALPAVTEISVSVEDDDGGTDDESLNIFVNNANPSLSSVGATNLVESGSTTLTGLIGDVGSQGGPPPDRIRRLVEKEPHRRKTQVGWMV